MNRKTAIYAHKIHFAYDDNISIFSVLLKLFNIQQPLHLSTFACNERCKNDSTTKHVLVCIVFISLIMLLCVLTKFNKRI